MTKTMIYDSKNINWMALGFAVLLAFQSCSVYRNVPVTVDEAVNSDTKVRIETSDGKYYDFHRISREDGNLIGYAKKDSRTARKLAGYSTSNEELKGMNRIQLDSIPGKEYHLKNKGGSIAVTIGAIVVPIAIIIGATFAHINSNLIDLSN